MRRLVKISLALTAATVALAASGATNARRGADDPADHIRQCRGCDDAAGHVRHGRGDDDAPGDGRNRGRGNGDEDSVEHQ